MPADVGAERVPEHLGVVMGMAVDEAGRDHVPLGIEGLRGALALEIADRGDQAVADAEVGAIPGQARAVHHRAAANDQVVRHVVPPESSFSE